MKLTVEMSLIIMLTLSIMSCSKSGKFSHILDKDITVICLDDKNKLIDFVTVKKGSKIDGIKFLIPPTTSKIKAFAVGANISEDLNPSMYYIGSPPPGSGDIEFEFENGELTSAFASGIGIALESNYNDALLQTIDTQMKIKDRKHSGFTLFSTE